MIYLLFSMEFILFFIAVFAMYWIVPIRFKNVLLLIASYLFYISWNWKFLSLILISTAMNYVCGLEMYHSKNSSSRKLYLILGITGDLLLLGFFKYFNFFIESLVILSNSLGFHLNLTVLNIILPLGISFYTFETMSYAIDIYRKKFAPTENLIDFALFVAYFPKLISGPIERSREIIPKIQAEKHFRNVNFKEGFYLFIYGLFKKIVIADSLSPLVNNIFGLPSPSGAEALIAVYAFAVQIYCDYSGYIDMARGVSSFFGINLSINFNIPYFAKNPSDFWRRWNITLSSWVRDYIYVPLGGQDSIFFGIFPLFIAWFIMGLWHGAALNFILWGMYWFIVIIAYRIIGHLSFQNRFTIINKIKSILCIIIMFHITAYGWIFFRSKSLSQIIAFTKSLFSGINLTNIFSVSYFYLYAIILFLIIYEFLQYYYEDTMFIPNKNFYWQMIFYITIFFIYIEIGSVSDVKFLYFQF